MRLNHHPENLKVGDKVTTDFYWREEEVVRKITFIREDSRYGSGFCATADDGEPCPHCKRPLSKHVGLVDASWFIPVEEEKNDSV